MRTTPHKLYDPTEIEEELKRGWSSIRWYQFRTKTANYYWLYWDRMGMVLAIVYYSQSLKVSQVLNPFGVWVKETPSLSSTPVKLGSDPAWFANFNSGTFESRQLPMVAKNMHVDVKLLLKAYQSRQYGVKPLDIGKLRNQWNTLRPDTTFEQLQEKIRAEIPESLYPIVFKSLKQARYDSYMEQARFSWEKVYADRAGEISRAFSRITEGKSFVDNYRVAKVGNRQHYHHYIRQQKRGCCGSHDEVVMLSDGQYHMGFNYGH